MQVLINIDEDLYTRLFDNGEDGITDMSRACTAIRKGITLPKEHDESDSKKMEEVAKAFQFGLAIGFGERHDEMDKVIDEIKKVITPQPKIGHWIIYDVHGHKACKCSECDKDVGYPCNYKYCPYCGHFMIKPQESAEWLPQYEGKWVTESEDKNGI